MPGAEPVLWYYVGASGLLLRPAADRQQPAKGSAAGSYFCERRMWVHKSMVLQEQSIKISKDSQKPNAQSGHDGLQQRSWKTATA